MKFNREDQVEERNIKKYTDIAINKSLRKLSGDRFILFFVCFAYKVCVGFFFIVRIFYVFSFVRQMFCFLLHGLCGCTREEKTHKIIIVPQSSDVLKHQLCIHKFKVWRRNNFYFSRNLRETDIVLRVLIGAAKFV